MHAVLPLALPSSPVVDAMTGTVQPDEAQPVWKMIYLARRNPQLSLQDFPQAWREHSALGRQCTNVARRVRSVAQCARVLAADEAALSHSYDGVNLMVLADRAAGRDIWDDPETLAVMRPDEPRVFADYVRHFTVLASQHLLHQQTPPGPPRVGQVILVGFLQHQPAPPDWDQASTAPAEPPAGWNTAALGQAQRIVCNVVRELPPPGYRFRQVMEWWFSSLPEARVAVQTLKALPRSWGDSVLVLTQVTHARP